MRLDHPLKMKALASVAVVSLVSPPSRSRRRPAPAPAATDDPVATLVHQLDLEKYKATIKGLTRFGDRRQGTERNRKAEDWIEAQLKSYGCTNTERIKYDFTQPTPRPTPAPGASPSAAASGLRRPRRAAERRPRRSSRTGRQHALRQSRAHRRQQRSHAPEGRDAPRPEHGADAARAPTPREQVYCTKIGTKFPNEMYIVGGHMDGIGWGEAANDDGSGTALVMELARILHQPGVETERSIRFILWNNEESGLNGASPTSRSARTCRASRSRRARASTRNRSGWA